ncbi:LacI family transcriptional regulator [Paenibacillus sp. J31TS4]|uniref:LacI family DNA-binding transcriptional regulator n=1 Tax=Paenibacillus sp. J31TS4 TaxID=2807195 RepID=UPI001B1D4A64|nr:LacI family DNA-binding transcriptional regulator [Paenibacillus sp. J31TS4]GIP38466.1 LacI family transcriptional regulator [Paenibacillus sp. J31TS4]
MPSLTIKDVAQAAGVSTATVSRVLNASGYVSEQIRSHVQQVMKELNYQPNALARSLKQERTRTVGIVLPDMTNPYFMTMARIVQQRLMENGYHLIYMDSGENPAKELEAIELLLGMRIEALVLAGTGENGELISHIAHSGTSVVLVDRAVDGVLTDSVVEDNAGAAEEAVAYLLGKYGTSGAIALLNGPESISTARERSEGARKAIRRLGMEAREDLVFAGDYTRQSGRDACKYWMTRDEPPQAVFSANNEMTYGFYQGLRELGIPLDAIEVVSFGELDAATLFTNRLSVIYQNPQQIGEAVAELVLKRLEDDARDRERRIFSPRFELTVR